MVDGKTGVATRINKIESRVYFTHCHCDTLQLAVDDIIKAIKIMRGTFDVAFELNKL